jgi:hypothetical protein
MPDPSRPRKLRAAFLAARLLVGLLLIAETPWQPAEVAPAVSQANSHGCALTKGRVFLITAGNSQGERGWLLFLDNNYRAGWLYDPPVARRVALHLSGSTLEVEGETSGDPDESHYAFRGIIEGESLRGTMTIRSGTSASLVQELEVRGSQVVPSNSRGRDNLFGRYSNVRYIQETGDLKGAELLIFRSNRQLAGLIVFYEGYWGEPVFVGIPLSEIHSPTRQKVEFRLKLHAGVGLYSASRVHGTLVLRRVGIAPAQDAKGISLVRQPHFLPEAATRLMSDP